MSAVIDPSQVPLSQGLAHAVQWFDLVAGAPGRMLAFGGGPRIERARFEREVRALAARLPQAACAVNLCENRYRFLVALCAVALRGQTNLLPSSRAPAVIDDVLVRFPDSYCIGDLPLDPPPPRYLRLADTLEQAEGEPLQVDAQALLAIGFTSGSTGQPKPNHKTWNAFRTSTAQNLAALHDLLRDGEITPLVATVPPQHMYGMEMSVLLPLLGPVAVHAHRPFFPGDVARALSDADTPPLLVTTPVHLRALVESGVELPALAGIVSATAPLPVELAQAAEARYRCEVREVFGSTETCVFARRRTALETAWTPLPGVRVCPQPDGTAIHAPHLPEPVVLADLMEVEADGRFVLRGRSADLLEIAGKRASLGDLTRKLLAIDGVRDGAVFQLDAADHFGVRRIAALAVAPGLSETQILHALRQSIDPVFLPRPLRCVSALPRNETGKLPRHALEAMLHSQE
ncbi:acyl-CoA synthetase [Lysobacter sp. ISL-42]|nr:acyl-CoA synthetase [Lysobacter sp. ISL-42]MBT2750349.1 acyl-CoA synthetase [Lysobacter sp. ISL-50]MBT2778447.1 acyl-CoA synthetase [Lysobacter sp. ISL-54]MBT2781063.1 acyl-CoA synthetase [Lysobacter sp. ISL-52]